MTIFAFLYPQEEQAKVQYSIPCAYDISVKNPPTLKDEDRIPPLTYNCIATESEVIIPICLALAIAAARV